MSLVYSYRNYLQVFFVSLFLVLITGCIGEDKDDDQPAPTNSDGDVVDNTSLTLNGFWNGGFEQAETLRMLIFNGDVYGLDEDKAFFGTVESPSEEEVDFTLTSYPFSYDDAANFEFVADGVATVYTINGLLATNTSLVGDFETDASEFGALMLANDSTYSTNSSLTSLIGKWTTTDLEMNITSRGRFHGVNNGTDKDCSFEGQIDLINSANSLLAITLNRRNCDDFNGDSTGFVAINVDGELELYSKMGSALLFMKFTAPAAAGGTTPDTEAPTEGEAEEPVVEEAAEEG
ncbi:hypothetical protein A9R00_11800 [Oleispira antarctica]|uniref:Uncharacterized protein n=1 Tax=Oleispira antarctica TaxID=188908 RepID=A0A1Y5HFA1_OLEAN|nr:hypothetical protein A9R00_11800 [Oleispira antarctica]